MITLPEVRAALASRPVDESTPPPSLAAVAMVLAGPAEALRLCFILRAEREGDRWSGQMAFPGGRAEPEDPTAQATAMREAHEEVGLRLRAAEALGSLPVIPMRPTGATGELAPYAFYAGPQPPALRPNDGEVADAFWIPVAHLWDPSQRGTIDWPWQGQTLRFPGIRYRGQIIWGLTYRVLAQWAELLGRPLPGAGEPPFRPVSAG